MIETFQDVFYNYQVRDIPRPNSFLHVLTIEVDLVDLFHLDKIEMDTIDFYLNCVSDEEFGNDCQDNRSSDRFRAKQVSLGNEHTDNTFLHK